MFKLSKKADYGLIAMKHLAIHRQRHSSSASEIAEEYGISATLMAKVLQKLARQSLVTAKHGSSGGYQIARDPGQISALDVISAIDGPVLISAGNLSGFEFGPGSLNPYEQFKWLSPKDVIDYGVFVFDGHFEIPLASALSHTQKAQNLLAAKQIKEALVEAQAAVALAPEAVQPQMVLGDVLKVMGQPEEARAAYEKALLLAKTIEPEFQVRSIPSIEQSLADK